MDSEVPRPCRHFLGREEELDELHTMLEENSKVFLYGIAGIGKSELAKAYAKQYKKYYTNILYVEYAGDLHQAVTDMDFTDDLPEDGEEERFRKHNRFLRSLKDDTLLIIDNFNVTATQDSFLPVVLKYRCRILFTTRSKFDGHCILQLKEIRDPASLFQLAAAFYSEAEVHQTLVEEIIEIVHRHTFAVELAAKLLENGILPPEHLLEKLREEKASLENEDKISAIKDGQNSKATYYNHIHTLFSLYSISVEQQEIMRNLCFLPPAGISARIFADWLGLTDLNDINDLIETGFVQATTRHTISLHPLIQEIALSETKPSVTACHTLLDSLQKICLMHGTEVSYYKKLFQTVGNIMRMMEKDDLTKYLLFLEDVFPYMEKYRYRKGMKEIILEMKQLLKGNENGSATDRALLLDYQACMETKPEKAIKLEKEALAQIKEITEDNAHLVSNLHANLGGLYRMNGQAELAKEHMEKGIFLLEQYQLLYTNDSIPQINNYAALLTKLQEPERAMAALQKLAQLIKEYNSVTCLDYAQVQESMGNICLITANISQAKTHFKKAMKIYENVWADEPELIEEKYQEIQELYPQVGIALARGFWLPKINKHILRRTRLPAVAFCYLPTFRRKLLFQPCPIFKSISYTFTQSVISVVYRIICDRCKFIKIKFSVISEISLIYTYIFDFCNILAAINHFYKLTFKSQWKLIDNRCIYKFTLCCSKTGFLHLIFYIIGRYNSHIITGNQMFKVCYSYCKSLVFYNIIRCLMSR